MKPDVEFENFVLHVPGKRTAPLENEITITPFHKQRCPKENHMMNKAMFEEKWSGNLLQMHHWLILGSVALSMGLAYKLLRKRAAGIWGHGD